MTTEQIKAAKEILERYGYRLSSSNTGFIVQSEMTRWAVVDYRLSEDKFLIRTTSNFWTLNGFTREASEAIFILGLLEGADVPIARWGK